MRTLAGVVLLVLVGACTSSDSSDSTTSTANLAPPSSIVTERLLAELDLEGLASSVARLRELEFLEPVPVAIVEEAGYRARVAELGATGPALDQNHPSSWLQLLGVLPDQVNAAEAATRLLQERVAFYDHEAKRILVRAEAGIDPYVESVVVHELVHALQQQHFGRADTRTLDGDTGYVYAALVDGDAERVARRFIGELSQSDEFAYEEGRLTASENAVGIRAGTPAFVQDTLSQPADHGVRFMQGMDYDAVDGFFTDLSRLTSLPRSSEALIFPDANLDLLDLDLPPPDIPGYERVSSEDTLGVGRLRLVIGLGLDDDVVDRALAGWQGDRFEVRESGEDVVLTYLFEGETAEDAAELAAAFVTVLERAPAQVGWVRVADNQALVVAASNPSLDETLDELYSSFGEALFRRPAG